MVTARTDEADRVAGLEAWVDDYVTKPFSPRELKARIKSVLRRRAPEAAQEPLTAGDLKLDPTTHRVTANGQPVPLGPTEFRLLRFLLARPERVHSRAQLLDQVWGDHVYIEERTVDVHIRRLRLALEPFKLDHLIETVRGTGYRLAAPTDKSPHAPAEPAAPAIDRGAGGGAGAGGAALGVRGRRMGVLLLALGWGAILAYHVVHLDRLTRWAEAELDTASAGRLRRLAAAFSGALPPRARTRRAHERDLAHTIERFQSAAEAIPDGMVVLDTQNRIKWANARAQSLLGLDLAQDMRRAAREPRSPAGVRPLPGRRRLSRIAWSSTPTATLPPRWRFRSCRSAWPRSS